MTVGYQDVNLGTGAGNHDGEGPFTGIQKIKDMLKELFGVATNSYKSVVLTAASTDDYSPWTGGFPQDFILDINPTTRDVIITSLVAGFDGQRGTIRNIGTGGFTITCPLEAGTGTAANKFYGSFDAGAIQGGVIRLVYCLLPNPRWYVG